MPQIRNDARLTESEKYLEYIHQEYFPHIKDFIPMFKYCTRDFGDMISSSEKNNNNETDKKLKAINDL